MREENSNRRRFPRIASAHVVLVSSTRAEEAQGFAKTVTLGLGGCGFVTDAELAAGDVVELLISLGGRAISTRARVAYTIPVDERREVGVEFVDIDSADLAFLKSRLPENAEKG